MTDSPHPTSQRAVLVTGSTGYVGGKLAPRLLTEGYAVRALVRDRHRVADRPWSSGVEIVEADVLEPATLPPAFEGIHTAYYLIHNMSAGDDFHQRDLRAAANFAAAAREAGVQRIIYLGGLGDPEDALSPHLASRQATGAALRDQGVPVTEMRAGVIVGTGSTSFEMVRYLTERIPVMICPSWVYTRIQPISIEDCVDYLVQALEQPASAGEVIEIGGSDILTYGEMMTEYAKERGLRRMLLPVPVLTPRLSSLWVNLVTPISAAIARPLIDGLRNEVIVRTDQAKQLFPRIKPVDYRTAVRAALNELGPDPSTPIGDLTQKPAPSTTELAWRNGTIYEQRSSEIQASPRQVFEVLNDMGGSNGWLYANWAWQLRGALDRLLGGPGLRREMKGSGELRPGAILDFWTVEIADADHLLRLRAETKLPGLAWLEYEIRSEPTLLIQTAAFTPKGLLGVAYWYALYPVHRLIFAGLLRKLAEKAQKLALQTQPV
jgi:uncharacterized protein YbjT (DUF2867 family)